jgi:hypothetical protein
MPLKTLFVNNRCKMDLDPFSQDTDPRTWIQLKILRIQNTAA